MFKALEGGISVTSQDVSGLENTVNVYFDIINEHSIQINNQITDNYIENNTTIQDHIAQSPIIVSLKGLVGELVYKPPMWTLNWLHDRANNLLLDKFGNETATVEKLAALPMLYPPVDNVTQLAKNAVQYVEDSVNRYKKIIKYVRSEQERISRLEEIYSKLMTARTNNKLFRVATPFKEFDNMAIQSLTLRQGNELYIGDIELTLKEIRTASTLTTEANKDVMAKYTEWQRDKQENCGIAQGKQEDISTLYKMTIK